MGQQLQFVAFDIETTGFCADDEVTVAGFVLPLGCRVFCQVPPGMASTAEAALESTLRARADTHVALSLHDSEGALLEAVRAFAGERLRDDDVLLVAYNGEIFNGGFDLPFLRTRLARTDTAWPFNELPYADLMPVVTNRFNTAVPGADTPGERDRDDDGSDQPPIEDQATLPAVYDVLVSGPHGDLDPFEDSAAAVRAFHEGDLEALLLHNLSDIRRTQALGELAQAYCSTSDIQLKSLTPTADAFDDGHGASPSGDGPAGGDHSRPS